MNKSLKRAIDYLAIEDADVCNELERGVDQISLQLVAHAFDIDPYVLLGKVWDRKWAWVCGKTEPIKGVSFKVTEAGVFKIDHLGTRHWVCVIKDGNAKRSAIALCSNRSDVSKMIRKYAVAKEAA